MCLSLSQVNSMFTIQLFSLPLPRSYQVMQPVLVKTVPVPIWRSPGDPPWSHHHHQREESRPVYLSVSCHSFSSPAAEQSAVRWQHWDCWLSLLVSSSSWLLVTAVTGRVPPSRTARWSSETSSGRRSRGKMRIMISSIKL